ncbi:MAG: 30S ribosomal protein S6 [Terriglobia bacterium]
MHKYEVMFIIRSDTPEDEVEKVISQMEGFVTGADGKILKTEKLGRRKLAYRVERQREGLYVLFIIEGAPATITELERRMKVTDAVIKFMTVRVDQEEKRAVKMSKIRAKQQAKRHKPAPPAVAAPPAREAAANQP